MDHAIGMRCHGVRATLQSSSADIMLVVHPDLARVARVRATMDFIVEWFVRDAALFTGDAK